MIFGHFGPILAFDLPQCQEPWRWGRKEELPRNEQKKTKKTTHRGKPRQTEIKQQRQTLGAGQTMESVWLGENVAGQKHGFARLGV